MIRLLIAVCIFALSQSAQAIEVHFEPDSRLPVVYLTVAVKTGVVSDPKGKSGLTHFMGRMLLRGTQNRTKAQIDQELDEIGASLNVETRTEALLLRGAVLSKNIDRFKSLVLEILSRPNFPSREIQKLKSEVKSEILASLGDDRGLASKGFISFLFDQHPYGKFPQGKTREIQTFNRNDLKSHYHRLFQSLNLILAGTGDAKLQDMNKFAKEIERARPGAGRVQALVAPANSSARRLLIIDKPGLTQTQIFFGQVGKRPTDPDFEAVGLTNHALGGFFNSILMEEIRIKRGWSYGAGSGFAWGTQPRYWRAYLMPATQYAPDALKLAVETVERIRKDGISKELFNRVKKSQINSAAFLYDTPQKRVENSIVQAYLNLPSDYYKKTKDRLEALTFEKANAAFRKFLAPNRFTFVVVGTASELKDKLASASGVPTDQVKVMDYQSFQ